MQWELYRNSESTTVNMFITVICCLRLVVVAYNYVTMLVVGKICYNVYIQC